MAYPGLHRLAIAPASSAGTDLPRTSDLADLLAGTTWPSRGAFIVFSLGALATHQKRWHLRHTVKGSAA